MTNTILGVSIDKIAKVNGIPIENISSWNGQELDTGSDFITEWVVPSDSLSVTLPLNNGNSSTFNCTVDWGDGSALSTITAYDDADRIHTYASAGTYQIKIRGTCEGWSFNDSGDKLKITKVINFGTGSRFKGFKWLYGGFWGCSNLSSIGTQYIKPSGNGLVTLFSCFANCTSLATIPADIFRYNINIDDFNATFYGCTSLATIPADIFRYNINVDIFEGCFYGCTKLQLRSDIFYGSGEQSTRFLNKTVNFTSCFYRTSFTGTQGASPDLWNCNFGTGTPNKTTCFGGTGNDSTSISNYADIPVEWK